MNCIEFRQIRLSDPYCDHVKADEHRDGCERCRVFEAGISSLDADLNQAISVVVPDGLAAKIMLNLSLQQTPRQPTRRLWLSMAASFFVVSIIAYQFYFQPDPISGPILAHVGHQPHEFAGAAHLPISNSRLASVLTNFNISANIENVVYAAVCLLDGEKAVHLVIKDSEDQYTIMLIPDQSPSRVFEINSDIWRGYISPHPAGALAILADASHPDAVLRLEAMRVQVQDSFYLTAEL